MWSLCGDGIYILEEVHILKSYPSFKKLRLYLSLRHFLHLFFYFFQGRLSGRHPDSRGTVNPQLKTVLRPWEGTYGLLSTYSSSGIPETSSLVSLRHCSRKLCGHWEQGYVICLPRKFADISFGWGGMGD